MDISGRSSAISAKGDNFCDFLLLFLHTDSLLKKGSTLGANSFLLEQIPFQKGSKNNLDRVASLEIVPIPLKSTFCSGISVRVYGVNMVLSGWYKLLY